MTVALSDLLIHERVGIPGQTTVGDVLKLQPMFFDFGGQFLLDPNEFNAWGSIGPHDNTNSQDLGNVGAAPNRFLGGFHRPFAFKVMRLSLQFRENNNTIVDPWGFRMVRQVKNHNTTGSTSTDILAEVAANGGVGPRSYANTNPQTADIDLSTAANNEVAAGEVLGFGVEAPTAITTNRYIQVMSGFIEYRRL